MSDSVRFSGCDDLQCHRVDNNLPPAHSICQANKSPAAADARPQKRCASNFRSTYQCRYDAYWVQTTCRAAPQQPAACSPLSSSCCCLGNKQTDSIAYAHAHTETHAHDHSCIARTSGSSGCTAALSGRHNTFFTLHDTLPASVLNLRPQERPPSTCTHGPRKYLPPFMPKGILHSPPAPSWLMWRTTPTPAGAVGSRLCLASPPNSTQSHTHHTGTAGPSIKQETDAAIVSTIHAQPIVPAVPAGQPPAELSDAYQSHHGLRQKATQPHSRQQGCSQQSTRCGSQHHVPGTGPLWLAAGS